MTEYTTAIIGTGRVGSQFDFVPKHPDNHADAIAVSKNFNLVAGVNRGRENLEAFGLRHGIDALYHDYLQMLEEIGPDLCIIATHPELHRDMVVGCASVPTTRAIICEKPMALSLEECDAMIEACSKSGVLLQINHNRRWGSQWMKIKELVDNGAIGELNHIYCYMDGGKPAPWWRSENEGPLLHDFTHYFDLLELYAGEVDWLCGMAEQRRRPWAVEDFSAAFIKFQSGVTALVSGAELTEYEDAGMELRGSTGVIRMDGNGLKLFQSHQDVYEPDSGFQWSTLKPQELDLPPSNSSYVSALEELYEALEGKYSLRSDGVVGRYSLEMVMGIYQSQIEGCRPVKFPVQLKKSGVEELRSMQQFVDKTD